MPISAANRTITIPLRRLIFALNPWLQLCHYLLCGKLSDLIDLSFKSRFHLLNDLLPGRINNRRILFPSLASSPLKNR